MRRWRPIHFVITLVSALICGLLYVVWGRVWAAFAFANTMLPGLQDLFYGFWLIAAVLAPALTRRPGTGLLAQTVAASIEAAVTGRLTTMHLAAGFVQAAAAEGSIALAGYERYDVRTLMTAGALTGVASLGFDRVLRDPDMTNSFFAVVLVTRAISGALLAGWLAATLRRWLVRIGPLKAFVQSEA